MNEEERKQTLSKLDQAMVKNIVETIIDKNPGISF